MFVAPDRLCSLPYSVHVCVYIHLNNAMDVLPFVLSQQAQVVFRHLWQDCAFTLPKLG